MRNVSHSTKRRLSGAPSHGFSAKANLNELLLLVLYVVIELDVNHGQAGEAEGANSEVRRARRLQRGIQGDGLLDGTSDQLLDLLVGSARPWALRGGYADRDVRVL